MASKLIKTLTIFPLATIMAITVLNVTEAKTQKSRYCEDFTGNASHIACNPFESYYDEAGNFVSSTIMKAIEKTDNERKEFFETNPWEKAPAEEARVRWNQKEEEDVMAQRQRALEGLRMKMANQQPSANNEAEGKPQIYATQMLSKRQYCADWTGNGDNLECFPFEVKYDEYDNIIFNGREEAHQQMLAASEEKYKEGSGIEKPEYTHQWIQSEGDNTKANRDKAVQMHEQWQAEKNGGTMTALGGETEQKETINVDGKEKERAEQEAIKAALSILSTPDFRITNKTNCKIVKMSDGTTQSICCPENPRSRGVCAKEGEKGKEGDVIPNFNGTGLPVCKIDFGSCSEYTDAKIIHYDVSQRRTTEKGRNYIDTILKEESAGNLTLGEGNRIINAAKYLCEQGKGQTPSGVNPFCEVQSFDREEALYYIGRKYPDVIMTLGSEDEMRFLDMPPKQELEDYAAKLENRKPRNIAKEGLGNPDNEPEREIEKNSKMIGIAMAATICVATIGAALWKRAQSNKAKEGKSLEELLGNMNQR